VRTALSAVVLGGLFAASVVNQVPLAWWRRIADRDPVHLLPQWSFFAPNPGTMNSHLVYRDRRAEGWGAWQELCPPAVPRARWLWNPSRFERKALTDLLSGLARSRTAHPGESIQLAVCYVALLTWVMAQPTTCHDLVARQFAILVATGHGADRRLRVGVVSNEHRVDLVG
jgi:hypothetical protein